MRKWSSRATRIDLGTRDIDAFRAEGKMRSDAIPAGEAGKRNAITVTDRTWFLPELQVTVMRKHSDPRSGENVHRLGSIQREEPSAALFTLPSDDKVKGMMAYAQRMLGKKAPSW